MLIVPEILRCIDFGILAWNCLLTPLFGEFFGHIFPIWMTSPIVLTPKRTFLGRKNVVWAIQRMNQCDGSTWDRYREKKIQDNKKSQKCYISPIWGLAPTGLIRSKSCMVGDVCDVITCANFQIEIFIGYDFTGIEFSIFLLIFAWALQQCSANALPVIPPW